MGSLAGKTLFITGASRGIGLAIALRAARDGAQIVIAAKSSVPNPKLPGTIHSAAEQVITAGGKALAIKCDIREEDDVRSARRVTYAPRLMPRSRPSAVSTSWSTTPARSGWPARWIRR
jgi:citronellol/citronellal dehydrogenase